MKHIFVILCSLLTVMTHAAVRVESLVDRNEMGLGDTVTLSVSVQSSESVEITEPRVPNLNGFDLVNSSSASSTSSKLMQGPGGMQFETVRRQDFNYMLSPKKQGTVTIPGFEVIVDGKTYNSKPISIHVSGQGSGASKTPPGMPPQDEMDQAEEIFNQLLQRRGMTEPPTSRTLDKNTNEAFFILCETDKTEVYEGEQIVVNWYIYTRGNILALDRLKFPDLKGFWKEIIEEVPALNFTQEIVNGMPFRKALLASHALFPIRPGISVIDEYKIKAQIQLPSNPFGAFGFGKPYTYQRSSERIEVKVKPLPQEGKPNSFSGAVGQFDVRSQVEGTQFPVNQPFSLKVRFEGSGNAKLIELPNLGLPTTVETYDTKSEAKFFKNGKSYKEFQVLLIPREEGQITLPAMNFSVFDPQQKKYVARTTEPITIKIVANPNAAAGAKNLNSPTEAQTTIASQETKNQLPDILVSWQAGPSYSLSGKMPWLWALVFLALSAALLWKARLELAWGQKQRDLRQEVQKRFKKVAVLIEAGQWREAGTEMTNSIYHVLGEVSGQGGANLEFSKLLDQSPPSLRRELGTELSRLVEVSQILSFAPESVVGKLKEKTELKKNAEETEKALLQALKLSENKTGT